MKARNLKLNLALLAFSLIITSFIFFKHALIVVNQVKRRYIDTNEIQQSQKKSEDSVMTDLDDFQDLMKENLISFESAMLTRGQLKSEKDTFEKISSSVAVTKSLRQRWKEKLTLMKAFVTPSIVSGKEINPSRSTGGSMMQTDIKDNHSETNRIPAVCEIPKLNPFDKEAMEYINDLAPLQCDKEDHGILEKGILKIKAVGLRYAAIRYIRRVDDDDFNVYLSKPVPILKQKTNPVPLEKGMVGCFVSAEGSFFGIVRESDADRLRDPEQLAELEECHPENFVRVLEKGQLQDFAKGESCFVLPESLNDVTNGVDCSEEKADHVILDGGILQHAETKSCLSLETDLKNKERRIVLNKECGNNSNSHLRFKDFPPVMNIDTEIKVDEEFIEMELAKEKSIITEHYAEVRPLRAQQQTKDHLEGPGLKYNVAFLMFDSQSAANFERKLQKTFAFVKNRKNSVILKGHTINGDGTTAQLCAMLVGIMEEHLPEARKGHSGSTTVDRWPFVFKNLSAKGYVTMFSEDDSQFGSFYYRLNGFEKQPTDHYPRPFWSRSPRSLYNEYCMGGRTTVQLGLNYTMSFHDAYKNRPRFSFTMFSRLFHNNLNDVKSADEDILNFLQRFEQKGHLANTILFVGADHGLRVSRFREKVQGKLEERLPFMALLLPPDLANQHPEFMTALKHNSRLLTTHFDIHATLSQILNHPREPRIEVGHSLFTKIDPLSRTCASSGIKDHWCPCLHYSDVEVTNGQVVGAAEAVVEHINQNIIGAIAEVASNCSQLTLASIKRAALKLPKKAVQEFEKTSKNSQCDECGVVLGEKAKVSLHSAEYEIVFTVEPSKGLFEAKVARNGTKWLVSEDISRINLYGDQPKCVQHKYPNLRKFCFCR